MKFNKFSRIFVLLFFFSLFFGYTSCRKETIEKDITEGGNLDSLYQASSSRLDSLFKAMGELPTQDKSNVKVTSSLIEEGAAEYLDKGNQYNLSPGYYSRKKMRVIYSGTQVSPYFKAGMSKAVIWPGNLITVESARRGSPRELSELASFRAPGRIVLPVVNGSNKSYAEVNDFSSSSVYEQLNDLISSATGSQPAQTQQFITAVRSAEELRFLAELGNSSESNKIVDQFDQLFRSNTHRKVMVRFKQVFFDLVFETPEGGACGLFRKSVRDSVYSLVSEAEETPLGYVSSVSYGRTIMLILERNTTTTLDDDALENDIRLSLSGQASLESLDRNYTYHCFQMGGKPISVTGSTIAQILEKISETAIVSDENPGIPLSYEVTYLSTMRNAKDQQKVDFSYEYSEHFPGNVDNDLIISGIYLTGEACGNPNGGNFKYTSNSSMFYFRMKVDIYKTIVDPEDETKLKTVHESHSYPEIGWKAKDNFLELYQEEMAFGPFSPDKNVTVELSFTHRFYLKRYNEGLIGGDTSNEEEFYRKVRFTYDPIKGVWSATNENYENDVQLFSKILFRNSLKGCRANLDVSYMVQSRGRNYPIEESSEEE